MSLIKKAFDVSEGNIPILITSLHSGIWKPSVLQLSLNSSDETYINEVIDNIKSELNTNSNLKSNNDLIPYIITVKLSKDSFNVFNNPSSIFNQIEQNKRNNIYIQFWELTNWIIKQAFRKIPVIWIDLHGKCSSYNTFGANDFIFYCKLGQWGKFYQIFFPILNNFSSFISDNYKLNAIWESEFDDYSLFCIDNSYFMNILSNNDNVIYLRLEIELLSETKTKSLSKFLMNLIYRYLNNI